MCSLATLPVWSAHRRLTRVEDRAREARLDLSGARREYNREAALNRLGDGRVSTAALEYENRLFDAFKTAERALTRADEDLADELRSFAATTAAAAGSCIGALVLPTA